MDLPPGSSLPKSCSTPALPWSPWLEAGPVGGWWHQWWHLWWCLKHCGFGAHLALDFSVSIFSPF